MTEKSRSDLNFKATFNQAAVGMSHVSLKGEWLLVNQRLCDIVGYNREELLSITFQDITHPEDLNSDLSFLERTLCGDINTYTLEKRYIRRDRSLVWINLTVSLVRDFDNTPLYFISSSSWASSCSLLLDIARILSWVNTIRTPRNFSLLKIAARCKACNRATRSTENVLWYAAGITLV